MSPVVVSVDAGTGSARASAFAIETGALVAHAAVEWTHPRAVGAVGGVDFDAASGWRAICRALHAVVIQVGAPRVAAVAATSMREGFVLIDRAGVELWACPNTDGRARSQADRLTTEGTAQEIYAEAGDWVSITAPARLRWLADHEPGVLSATHRLLMLSDWITFKLTGVAVTEPSCGSSTALFNLAHRTWSTRLAELVGVDPRILPEVVEPGTPIGTITDGAAADTGLRPGTPVVAGGADTQLALYAIDADTITPTLVAGTFWQTTVLTDRPVIDQQRRVRTLCHVEPGSWMIEGIGFLCGLAMRWVRTALYPDLATRKNPYDAIEAEAACVPRGARGVRAILSDSMHADGWTHSVPILAGMALDDPIGTGRGAIARAVEEAAAFVTAEHLTILGELTPALAEHRLVLTGGTSNGVLWPQIIAEATGRSVRRSAHPEATSYGAARLAAAAIGSFLTPIPLEDDTVEPDVAAIAEYATLHASWRRAYDAMRDATPASGMSPLFDPPGAARAEYAPRA